jgi:hypothetical protein
MVDQHHHQRSLKYISQTNFAHYHYQPPFDQSTTLESQMVMLIHPSDTDVICNQMPPMFWSRFFSYGYVSVLVYTLWCA